LAVRRLPDRAEHGTLDGLDVLMQGTGGLDRDKQRRPLAGRG
jgi:hypothetical protein